jgi:peptide/nickel transport system permease protein
MGGYVLRRLLISVPVLIGVTVLIFIFINVAPGDPVEMMFPPIQGGVADEEYKERLRERLGLNEPLPVRYLKWLREIATGNLGYSILTGRSVRSLIAVHLRSTLELALAAYLISLVVGVSFGVISALKQYGLFDYVFTVLSLASLSVPGFFLGLVFIYVFGVRLHLLPTSGMQTLGQPFSWGDHLLHLIMPAVVLGTALTATLARYARSSLLEVLGQDYVTTARGKGLKERVVVLRHAFRNAMLPVITILGLRLPFLIGGAVIIEQVFVWPGMGLLTVRAVLEKDYPVLMGVSLLIAIVVLLGNLMTDIAYAYVDPRIRYE